MNDRRMGYDARSKEICDLVSRGIIDPVKVVKSALKYGAGLASIMLTAECSVVEE
jgi:chaperonin GroEL